MITKSFFNRLVLLVLLMSCLCACSKKAYIFTSFHEPANEGLRLLYSLDGYKWTDLNRIYLKPEIGNNKIMRDPSMVQGPDGVFHLVWTCGWKGERGFGYASSTDLIHWSDQKFVPVLEDEPTTVNVWAPEIFYDDVARNYIIVWASTIPFRFAKGIEEEENNHRLYSTTTTDFKSFTPAKLFLEPGFSVIDAVIVKRKKEDFVLVLKDNTRPQRNIEVAFSNKAEGPYTKISAPFTGKLTEGPSVLKTGKDWLIYYDAYGEKRYSAQKTKDFKTFVNVSTEVSVPEGHKHGTIVPVKRKIIKKLIENNQEGAKVN